MSATPSIHDRAEKIADRLARVAENTEALMTSLTTNRGPGVATPESHAEAQRLKAELDSCLAEAAKFLAAQHLRTTL